MTKAIQEKRRRYRAAIAGEGKASYQKKYDKAMSGRDPQAAIAAKCLDCMYWQRSRITECPIVCCPLWLYRPFVSAQALEPPAPARKSRRSRSSRAAAPRRSTRAKRPTRKQPVAAPTTIRG